MGKTEKIEEKVSSKRSNSKRLDTSIISKKSDLKKSEKMQTESVLPSVFSSGSFGIDFED
jgi:hypothetical protein